MIRSQKSLSAKKNAPDQELPDHVIRVEVSMSRRFLQKVNAHLVRVAENNRSAWVRQACLKLMREEQQDLSEEAEG